MCFHWVHCILPVLSWICMYVCMYVPISWVCCTVCKSSYQSVYISYEFIAWK
jgi:hypothetical protein